MTAPLRICLGVKPNPSRSRVAGTETEYGSSRLRNVRVKVNRDGALRPVFVERRWEVYQQELSPTLGILAILLLLSLGAEALVSVGVAALTIADLVVVGRERRGDLGRSRPSLNKAPCWRNWRADRRPAHHRFPPQLADDRRCGKHFGLSDVGSAERREPTALAGQLPGEIPAEAIRDAVRDRRSMRILDPIERRDIHAHLKWPDPGATWSIPRWPVGDSVDWVAQGAWASTFRIAPFDDALAVGCFR